VVGYNLLAPFGREVDYDPGEIFWTYRAMLAEDIPAALRVLEMGGCIAAYDFGAVPQLLPCEHTLVNLLRSRIDHLKVPGGKSYYDQVLERELEAMLLAPERDEQRDEILLLAA
jgi:hypothetical protein